MMLRLALLLALAVGALAQGQSTSPESPPAHGVERDPTKKGLQVQMTEDAIELGIGHATLNVLLTPLIGAAEEPGAIRWERGDDALWIRERQLAGLDAQVAALSGAGVSVNLILLGNVTGGPEDDLLLDPDRDEKPTNGYAGFRAHLPEGRAALGTLIDFLAARYDGGSRGRVHGWIVGNEVNSHGHWHSVGDQPLAELVRRYCAAVREVHAAASKRWTQARVYVSLDHFWTGSFRPELPERYVGGRPLLEAFAAEARRSGDFPWNVAHHPYPEDLFDPAFWLDSSAPHGPDARRVTFENLDVLGRFLARPEMRFEGRMRRVILSEQGFHRRDGEAGERLQAAALAAAMRIVDASPFIDALVLHRHVDHAHEGGLRLGLWTREGGSVCTPEHRTLAHRVFAALGTDEEDEVTAFALEVIGAESWEAFLAPRTGAREAASGR